MPISKREIIVVGAGIGGLAAALALQRAGQKVTVFEQAETLGEVGAGLSISPNGAPGLKSLGVMDEFRRVTYAPDYQLLRHCQNGRILAQAPRFQSADPDSFHHDVPVDEALGLFDYNPATVPV